MLSPGPSVRRSRPPGRRPCRGRSSTRWQPTVSRTAATACATSGTASWRARAVPIGCPTVQRLQWVTQRRLACRWVPLTGSRARASIVLVVLGAILLIAGALAFYAREQIIDREAFADRAVEALEDDGSAPGGRSRDRVYLVDRGAADLAAARPLVESVVGTLIQTDPFQRVFRGGTRRGQPGLLRPRARRTRSSISATPPRSSTSACARFPRTSPRSSRMTSSPTCSRSAAASSPAPPSRVADRHPDSGNRPAAAVARHVRRRHRGGPRSARRGAPRPALRSARSAR